MGLMKFLRMACIITAVVSSHGHVINVDNLRYLKEVDGGTLIAQYYNPPFIISDWSLKRVEQVIIGAISAGCSGTI